MAHRERSEPSERSARIEEINSLRTYEHFLARISGRWQSELSFEY